MSRTRIALLTLAALMSLGAQAQAANDAPLTRDQVRAEFLNARAEGRLTADGEIGFVPQVSNTKSTITRAEVLRQLAADGPAAMGEGSDLGNNPTPLSLRSRAEVRAEAVALVRSGVRIGGEK